MPYKTKGVIDLAYCVYNSPSLQEHNAGAIPGYIEETVMNKLCDEIERLQDYNGIKHYRNKPDMTLAQVVPESNKIYKEGGYNSKNYLHDAYHTNAASDNTVRGGEVLIFGKKYPDALRAAQLRLKYLEPVTPSKDRGVKERPELKELNSTAATAVLTEFIFHTNVDDARDMIERMTEYAKAVVHSQCEFFGIPFSVPGENEADIQRLKDENTYLKIEVERLQAVIDQDTEAFKYIVTRGK